MKCKHLTAIPLDATVQQIWDICEPPQLRHTAGTTEVIITLVMQFVKLNEESPMRDPVSSGLRRKP